MRWTRSDTFVHRLEHGLRTQLLAADLEFHLEVDDIENDGLVDRGRRPWRRL